MYKRNEKKLHNESYDCLKNEILTIHNKRDNKLIQVAQLRDDISHLSANDSKYI